MNLLEKLINDSNVTIIIGDSKSGKNNFALYIIKHILKQKGCVLSSLESSLYRRKISTAQENFNNFTYIGQDFSYFLLKNDFINLKRTYSYDFLEEEFYKIIKQNEDLVIYINRFEEFFEQQDRQYIEPLFKAILQFAEKEKKKLIFVVSSSSYHFDFIYPILKDFSDLILSIKKITLTKRLIEVKYSFENNDNSKFNFFSRDRELYIEDYQKQKSIQPTDESDKIELENIKNDDKIHILIISSNLDLISFHKYLFDYKNDENFKISFVKNNPLEALQMALKNPNLIIYNPDEKILKLDICNTIKENSLKSEIFYIFNKNFLRTSEKSKAIEAGCHKLFSENFDFENYVLSLQKSINYKFYENRFDKINPKVMIFWDRTQFNNEIKIYLRNKIIFTIFQYVYSKEKNAIEKLINLMRDYDKAFIDKKRGVILYLAINTRKNLGEAIKNRLKTLDKTIDYKNGKNASEFMKN